MSPRVQNNRRPKKNRLGQFSKGLLLGLLFGLLLAALTAWMIGSRELPQNAAYPKDNLKPKLSQSKQEPSTLPREFGFYNQTNSKNKIPKKQETHQSIIAPKTNQALTLTTIPYNNLSEVESIKAHLALSGFEPKIQVIKGKFLLQLGPYKSTQKVQQVQKELGEKASLFMLQ